jgi:site-specific DNA-methyltransferase (adenine-specific)
MQLITIDARNILLDDRLRSDLGPKEGAESIMGLAESLERGQIHPIVLNGNDLRAGGRRLAACLFLASRGSSIGALSESPDRKLDPFHILAVQFNDLSRKEQLEIEIEENTRRKNFTKAEEALGIKKLQDLLGEQAGLPDGERVSVRDVARAAGVSPATVTMGLRVAAAVAGDPTNKKLLEANSISGAYTQLRSQERMAERIKQISKAVPTEQLSKNLFNLDAREWLPKLPAGSIDLWSFDPPWGIGIDDYDRAQKYDSEWTDEYDMAKKLMQETVPHLYRTLKENSWMFSFFGIQFYDEYKALLEKVGFKVYPVPYVWYKPNKVGAQNDPSRFDMNQWEPIFLCAKGDPRIFKQAKGNVLSYDMPARSERFHFAQKSMPLMMDLIERFSFGSMIVADPMAGSFVSIKAAKKLGRQYLACEKDKANYDQGIIYINSPE